MADLTDREKTEWRRLAHDPDLRADCQALRNTAPRERPLDPDAYIEFVTQMNAFCNHQPKPATIIREGLMRL